MAEDLTATSDNPGGELDWIPENFRRDTVEESARVLLESQKEAQRKITEEATARRNLENLVAQQQSALEQWQAQAAQQPVQDDPDMYSGYDPELIAVMRAEAERISDSKVAAYAQQSQKQADAVQISQSELVADTAFKALEAQYGELSEETRNEMAQIIAARPHIIPPEAFYSSQKLKEAYVDVLKIAGADKNPPAQNAADLQRAMKLNAQTATGAGGHLSTADEAQQRWQEITNASTGKLGL